MPLDPRFMNRHVGTTIYPCEFIGDIGGRKMRVREMLCVRDPAWIPTNIAGTTNYDEQVHRDPSVWSITSHPQGAVITLRYTKGGRWLDDLGAEYRPSAVPIRFHDFGWVDGSDLGLEG